MSNLQDARFMALALSLGRRGLGRVWPNPSVGCVIVKDGVIVGRARTADGGRPHAETIALAQAGAAAKGATVYVTLEPCAHHGKTPPCADALSNAGVARVVVAMGDPHPRVSGRGLAMLRAAGITVDCGVLEDQARRDQAGFLMTQAEARPFVTLKLAGTLDGRIATASGESQWITGPAARRCVHMMRASHDAVMVGAGTARADDPSLTVRGLGITKQPVRVVVSRNMKMAQTAKLAQTADQVPLWLCHGPDADVAGLTGQGAVSVPCALDGPQVDLRDVLANLTARGITRVFCEGGGMMAASLLHADLVDELVVFSAGMVIGAEGTPALAALGVARLDAAPRFVLDSVHSVGPDICHRWRRNF
ncbi:bifunctional diaminohydroxyphosphoribosylaminopyrimidine deaminase/5-amino-6-(5-phosphoribosylamino)uracil reductase RibD [Yoonia sp. BS5-3]|uniref:Riboflavin biosynthesis protein RibD n=1 Tax=Yoonia phaeophyticola TaxID=3137369 RepID=A0ABZ2V7C8_9RHOB